MTKVEFLQQLYNHLAPLTSTERDDIISDFEEHFSIGMEIGKTEEQICNELGNPYNCALQYLRQAPKTDAPPPPKHVPEPPKADAYYPKSNPQPENVYARRNNLLWTIMFFVLVFLAIGVYPTSAGLILGGVGTLVISIFSATLFSSWIVFGLLISASVLLFCFGLLGVLVMTVLLRMAWKRSGL